MAKKRRKKSGFSTVKAVKANARERIGQPKAERVIKGKLQTDGRSAKHKPSVSDLLSREEQ